MRGFYCLVISLDRDVELALGRRGRALFPAGTLVYSGSALGGVEARVARHVRSEKRTHWHIDYLLAHATVIEVWAGRSDERLECLCARLLQTLPGAMLPFSRFGASDCRCAGHLVWLPARPRMADLALRLAVARPGTELELLSPAPG
ncbi:MAG: GIY-YIG nuclease family protein [Chloroflexi bacterium]|nr:GIY-YIG nuclease family protein [Chloroflexota bacterium]